jgi:hypothetical protein
MGVVRGKDFKLYADTSLTATPDWTELTNCRDVTRNLEKALADASTRLSDYRQQVGTLKELSLDFQIVYDPDDELFQLLADHFDSDENLMLLDLDGSIDVVGTKGLQFDSQITAFKTSEALEDVGLVDVTAVVAYSSFVPTHVSVTTGGAVVPVARRLRKGEQVAEGTEVTA